MGLFDFFKLTIKTVSDPISKKEDESKSDERKILFSNNFLLVGEKYECRKNTKKKRKDVIEMYDKARFMSLTGVKTPDSTDSLAKLEDDVRMANKLYIGEIEPVKEKVVRGDLHESDAELIEKIRNSRQGKKFSALFDCGGVSGDDSVDDFNLCLILAFWTRCNESMMDRIFRQSALMRRKWDRPQSGGTYGSVTIANACKNSNAQRYEKKKS